MPSWPGPNGCRDSVRRPGFKFATVPGTVITSRVGCEQPGEPDPTRRHRDCRLGTPGPDLAWLGSPCTACSRGPGAQAGPPSRSGKLEARGSAREAAQDTMMPNTAGYSYTCHSSCNNSRTARSLSVTVVRAVTRAGPAVYCDSPSPGIGPSYSCSPTGKLRLQA